MSDKKEVKQNSELNDEELENVGGGLPPISFFHRPHGTFYILDAKEAGVEKEENCLWGVLDDRGHVLYRTSDYEEAHKFAKEISGFNNRPNNENNVYRVSEICSKEDLQKLRRKARIKHFFHL